MRKYELVEIKEERLIKLTCDVCGMDLMSDEMERQEAFHFSQIGGYSSVFGDGNEIYLDICQHCFKRTLGQYCEIK